MEKFYRVFVTALVEQMGHVDICQRVCLIFKTQLQNKMIHFRVQAPLCLDSKEKGFGFNSSLQIKFRKKEGQPPAGPN